MDLNEQKLNEQKMVRYIGLVGDFTEHTCAFKEKLNYYKNELDRLDDWMASYINENKEEAEEYDLEMILKANRFLRDKPVNENICKKLIKKIVIRNLRIHKMQTEFERMHRKFNTRMDKILKSWKRGQIDDYALVTSTLQWKREVEMGDPHYQILTECAAACVIKTIENHRKILAQGVHNE